MVEHLLIPGGTGFIGQLLARRWLQMGRHVTLLTRAPRRIIPGLEDAQQVGWDGRSIADLDLIESVDAVVNLAGENIGASRWTTERLHRILQSRLDVGMALVDAFMHSSAKPSVFVQASAVGYYGTSLDATLTESAPAGKDTLARIAVDWENSTAALERIGVRRIVIRTGLVLAPDKGSALDQLALPIRLYAGGPLGHGRQWLSWIHWEDEVDAIIYLLDHPEAQGVYNLTAPNPMMQRDFSKELASVLKKPFWVTTPAFALRMVLGEMSTLVLDGQKALPQRLLDAGYEFHYPQARAALEQIYAK